MNSGLTLLAGLIVLLAGGELLVRGASALARNLGVSPFMVGLTVVAFGTSAPELAVNVAAAISGNGDITFGNVIGSNITNIGLIIGLTALLQPLSIHRSIVSREIPIMLAATALAILLTLDFVYGAAANGFGGMDGLIFLACFIAFLIFTTRTALRDRRKDRFLQEAEQDQERAREMHWAVAVLLTLAGLAGVLLGSDWTVQGASGVAAAMGMSQAVIGLTIVALGTSLPELTTSLFAVRKGQADLAIGNVVGSNIFNLLFILGVSSSIRLVPVPARGFTDLAAMAVFSLVLLPFAMSQRKLARHEGFLLLAGYLAYMAWRTFSTS